MSWGTSRNPAAATRAVTVRPTPTLRMGGILLRSRKRRAGKTAAQNAVGRASGRRYRTRMRRLAVLVVLASSGAGCMDADQPLSERGGAVGEQTNGFPSAIERLGLMAIHRARSDPQTVKGPSSAPYEGRPPALWR